VLKYRLRHFLCGFPAARSRTFARIRALPQILLRFSASDRTLSPMRRTPAPTLRGGGSSSGGTACVPRFVNVTRTAAAIFILVEFSRADEEAFGADGIGTRCSPYHVGARGLASIPAISHSKIIASVNSLCHPCRWWLLRPHGLGGIASPSRVEDYTGIPSLESLVRGCGG
jgi:hypothetical protein